MSEAVSITHVAIQCTMPIADGSVNPSTLPTAALADEICFFDLETTFPTETVPLELIEFGCVNVKRVGLYETSSYSTLIRPLTSKISKRSTECNGISEAMLATAPTFKEVAERIHAQMHGRVWSGHNVNKFDIPVLTRAFAHAGLEPPQCAGVVDTLELVRSLFKNRAGSNRMADLTEHFGLGIEKHRAVSDCRHTIEVLKCVAMTLLLEDQFADLFPTPPRPETTTANAVFSSASFTVAPATPVTEGKRPRGRPRKSQTPQSAPAAASDNATAQCDLVQGIKALQMNGGDDDDDRKAPVADEAPFVLDRVISMIDACTANHEHAPVWVTYEGGSTPGAARSMSRIQWVTRPRSFTALAQRSITAANAFTNNGTDISSDANNGPRELTFLAERISSILDTAPPLPSS